jgi:hypothetical protein
MEDEVFGPLLPVLTYSSLDEALRRMSQAPRPLAGFVFSRNELTINRFINELSYGSSTRGEDALKRNDPVQHERGALIYQMKSETISIIGRYTK